MHSAGRHNDRPRQEESGVNTIANPTTPLRKLPPDNDRGYEDISCTPYTTWYRMSALTTAIQIMYDLVMSPVRVVVDVQITPFHAGALLCIVYFDLPL